MASTDDTTGYRVVAELVQLPPAGSVVGSVAWRSFYCGWRRG